MAVENKKEFDYEGEMANYKITGEAFFTDEEGNRKENLDIGSVHAMPIQIGDVFVEQGVAEKVPEFPDGKVSATEIEVETTQPTGTPIPEEVPVVETLESTVKTYEGKEVISDGFREVNGRDFHHIKLSDGSSYDLTEEEYALKVTQPTNG